jgi:hypothetical protein
MPIRSEVSGAAIPRCRWQRDVAEGNASGLRSWKETRRSPCSREDSTQASRVPAAVYSLVMR